MTDRSPSPIDTMEGATSPIDWTDEAVAQSVLGRLETREKGRYYEDFSVGETIVHARGCRLSRAGNDAWMAQTLNHDPAYWRREAARRRGFDEPPVHPDYLLACVMGASVEDLSEKGGYFLGRTDLRFERAAVAPGTELHVESDVVSARESSSRLSYGIVTWRTRGLDAATGEKLCSYERTNMVPRRSPVETDGGGSVDDHGREADASDGRAAEHRRPQETARFVTPAGGAFEDFAAALDLAIERDAIVAYRHERGRTMDDLTVTGLPLATLNSARQHHDRHAMGDTPSGDVVAYGDVTRSIALAHARSDERTVREVGCDDERFHDFVTRGDTIYGATQVLDVADDGATTGTVTFQHVALNQHDVPVYSGTRIARIQKRGP